jgi:hypothetical protein
VSDGEQLGVAGGPHEIAMPALAATTRLDAIVAYSSAKFAIRRCIGDGLPEALLIVHRPQVVGQQAEAATSGRSAD